MNDIIEYLKNNNINYRLNISAKEVSTYKGGGAIALGAYPSTIKELTVLQQLITNRSLPYYIVGAGSNLLIADSGYHGLCIFTDNFVGLWADGNTIYAGSAEKLPKVARFAEQHSLTGLEGLSAIPATIGGAITMNAGAYGQDISSIVTSISVFDFIDGKTATIPTDKINWGYRSSGQITQDKIIISASLLLSQDSPSLIKERTRYYGDLRRQKQPQLPSLGSVFKSARGISAGYYIEKVGLKGVSQGGAEISDIHAGFIVNKNGNGTASDYLALMTLAKNTVKTKCDIDLVPEVVLLK